MAMTNQNKEAQQRDVRLLGMEVRKFMEEHGMKAQYVRMASHFGSSKFSDFKKVS